MRVVTSQKIQQSSFYPPRVHPFEEIFISDGHSRLNSIVQAHGESEMLEHLDLVAFLHLSRLDMSLGDQDRLCNYIDDSDADIFSRST